jgi:hypothetical protein
MPRVASPVQPAAAAGAGTGWPGSAAAGRVHHGGVCAPASPGPHTLLPARWCVLPAMLGSGSAGGVRPGGWQLQLRGPAAGLQPAAAGGAPGRLGVSAAAARDGPPAAGHDAGGRPARPTAAVGAAELRCRSPGRAGIQVSVHACMQGQQHMGLQCMGAGQPGVVLCSSWCCRNCG